MAGEGLFTGVDTLVGDEEGPPTEDLPAVRTAIEGLVHGLFRLPSNGLPALVAVVGSLRCTAPAAGLQPSTLSW